MDLIRGLKCKEDMQYIRRLVQNGADVNAIYTRYRHTSLIAASGFNNHANLQAIKLLIENGADVNVVDIYGVTPLMYAAGIQKHSNGSRQDWKRHINSFSSLDIEKCA